MELEHVEERVCAALSKLLEKDHHLLKKDANERSITHRLGIYLQEMFPEWDVDCEYNLDGHKPKRTNGRVFPDIIVHRRGTKCNLLVIEAKKTTSSESDIYDLNKLCEFKEKEELRYKHALFIKLGAGADWESKPELTWIDALQHCR